MVAYGFTITSIRFLGVRSGSRRSASCSARASAVSEGHGPRARLPRRGRARLLRAPGQNTCLAPSSSSSARPSSSRMSVWPSTSDRVRYACVTAMLPHSACAMSCAERGRSAISAWILSARRACRVSRRSISSRWSAIGSPCPGSTIAELDLARGSEGLEVLDQRRRRSPPGPPTTRAAGSRRSPRAGGRRRSGRRSRSRKTVSVGLCPGRKPTSNKRHSVELQRLADRAASA